MMLACTTNRGIPLLVLLLLLLLPTACATADETSPPCPENFARVDLMIDGPPDQPVGVSPPTVYVYMPDVARGHSWVKRQVCWVVHGLKDGETLHIARKPDQEDLFQNLQRTVSLPRTTAMSGAPAKKGTWQYSLWVVDAEGDKVHVTDPEVIIKDEW